MFKLGSHFLYAWKLHTAFCVGFYSSPPTPPQLPPKIAHQTPFLKQIFSHTWNNIVAEIFYFLLIFFWGRGGGSSDEMNNLIHSVTLIFWTMTNIVICPASVSILRHTLKFHVIKITINLMICFLNYWPSMIQPKYTSMKIYSTICRTSINDWQLTILLHCTASERKERKKQTKTDSLGVPSGKMC